MKHLVKKSWILGSLLVCAFLVVGFFNQTSSVVIETIPTNFMNLLHKTRLHSLYFLNGIGNDAELKVSKGDYFLKILNGLVISSGSGFVQGNDKVLFSWYDGNNPTNTVRAGFNVGIVGGAYNKLQGDNAGIAGGQNNNIEGNNIVIGGGNGNVAFGESSAIAGGIGNRVDTGVVVGGSGNNASKNGVVLGGINNKAGENSLALGENGRYTSIRDGSFTWNARRLGYSSKNVAIISATGGVLIGTYTPIDNVVLVVSGAVKLGNHTSNSFGGEVSWTGGCFYGYVQGGYSGNVFGNASLASGNCGVFTGCEFGESLLMNGDTVTGYANYFSTGTCKGERISCNNGSLSKTGYYSYCYEIGSGSVFELELCGDDYTLTYNCNGGNGGPYSYPVNGKDGGKLKTDGCTKANATLIGWALDPNATVPKWGLGAKMSGILVTKCENKTLYAVYREKGCQGMLPTNATLWNSTEPVDDTTKYSYSETNTLEACKFRCNTNYTWNGISCVGVQNTCQGTLPLNAKLNNISAIPSNNTTEYFHSSSSVACAFKCIAEGAQYIWNSETKTCDAISHTCQGTFPDNAVLNNESAVPSNDTTYYEYSETSTAACKFRCNTNYTWNESSCVKPSYSCATTLSNKYKCVNGGNYIDGTAKLHEYNEYIWYCNNGSVQCGLCDESSPKNGQVPEILGVGLCASETLECLPDLEYGEPSLPEENPTRYRYNKILPTFGQGDDLYNRWLYREANQWTEEDDRMSCVWTCADGYTPNDSEYPTACVPKCGNVVRKDNVSHDSRYYPSDWITTNACEVGSVVPGSVKVWRNGCNTPVVRRQCSDGTSANNCSQKINNYVRVNVGYNDNHSSSGSPLAPSAYLGTLTIQQSCGNGDCMAARSVKIKVTYTIGNSPEFKYCEFSVSPENKQRLIYDIRTETINSGPGAVGTEQTEYPTVLGEDRRSVLCHGSSRQNTSVRKVEIISDELEPTGGQLSSSYDTVFIMNYLTSNPSCDSSTRTLYSAGL